MLISVILGIATGAVVLAAEKGIDAAVCNKKAAARYDVDDFDDDLFCEDCGVSPQAPQQTAGPIDQLFKNWKGAVDEQLNILRGGGEPSARVEAPPIEVIRNEPKDVIDDVFEDIVDDVQVVEETPVEEVEETVAEEVVEEKAEETAAAAAPEREPNGRFKGKKKK